MGRDRGYIPPQGLVDSWWGILPSQGVKALPVELLAPTPSPPTPPVGVEDPLSDLIYYPFGQDVVIDDCPDYDYTGEDEVSVDAYTEMFYFEIEQEADLLSLFVNFVWAMAITGVGTAKTKWQIKSGLYAGGGSYIDLTDEVEWDATEYSDFQRSGVPSGLASFPTTIPITIRLVGKKGTADSVKAKIKSNTYARPSYQIT